MRHSRDLRFILRANIITCPGSDGRIDCFSVDENPLDIKFARLCSPKALRLLMGLKTVWVLLINQRTYYLYIPIEHSVTENKLAKNNATLLSY